MHEYYNDHPAAEAVGTSSPGNRRWNAAQALTEIKANTSLTPIRKRDETSAMVALIRMCRPVNTGPLTASTIDQTAPLVELECAKLRIALFGKSAAMHGFKDKKRFDAVLTVARATMRRLGVHAADLPSAKDLPYAWGRWTDQFGKYRLASIIAFFGYCAIHGIGPEEVGPETLDRFEVWLTQWTLTADPQDRARRTASTWNWAAANVCGFPQVRLTRANMSDHYAPSWEKYADSVNDSVRDFADWLAGRGNHDIADALFSEAGIGAGARKNMPKQQPRTISTRVDCAKIAFAALVHTGIPIEELRSVQDLVSPAGRVQQVMRFHMQRTQDHLRLTLDEEDVPQLHEVKSSNLFNICETLRKVAMYCGLPPAEIEVIRAFGGVVTKPKPCCMTDKNRRLLAALVQPDIMQILLVLPQKLMRQAEALGLTVAGARLALTAVALEILIMAPIRRENLTELRLDKHLLRTHPNTLIHEIYVRGNKVKNRATIEAPMPVESAELIERYLRDYRMLLTMPGNPYLFPSDDLDVRQAAGLFNRLKKAVEDETGCEWNGHIMRHFAVYRHLEKNPGDFETAARLLGDHPDTVRRFYDGLTTRFAAKKYSDSVVEERGRYAGVVRPTRWLRRSKKESDA